MVTYLIIILSVLAGRYVEMPWHDVVFVCAFLAWGIKLIKRYEW